MFRRKIPGKKNKRDEWDFFDDELKTFKAGYKSPCLSILQAMTSIYQGKKKRYMERLYCPRWTIESQPYMSRCKKGNPEGFPVLKERTVFALVTPFCCSLVSLSGSFQSFLPPSLSQGSWIKAAVQTPLLCCLPDSHELHLHKDPLPCCCRLWQASCGANSKLSLHRNLPLGSLLVVRPA